MIKINKANIIGISIGATIIFIALTLLLATDKFDANWFYFISGIGLIISCIPFFLNLLLESKRERDLESMFLEFARDLAEGAKSGTPINKSIMNLRNKDYSSLNPYVNKLANQVSLGIPVRDALKIFADDIKSQVISRAVSLIKEAERSGGKIETILDSVTYSISQVEKLKKERRAAIYNLTVQGYIIFMIFIAIMLVMQFKILPITNDLGNIKDAGTEGIDLGIGGSVGGVSSFSSDYFTWPLFFLLIVQGFFTGLVIGKISEGSVRSGLKHSFVLVSIALLIATGSRLFLSS
jgi:flagellar protein FlaJ